VLPGLKNWLLGQPGVAAAMMSGSGSTVFAVLREGAEDFSDKLAAAFGPSFQTFRCHLLGGVGHRMS
jgi:4-diphosphocytidyl-2C-methyl-D-erythritol kinase